MIYVYAIVEGLIDVTGIRGVRDEPLTAASMEQVTIVTGTFDEPPAITRESLSAQDHAIRALQDRSAALLPMRFGAAFASLDDVARAVAVHASGLRERLERVRQREQMTLRITSHADTRDVDPASAGVPLPDVSTAREGAGAAYLRERARPRELRPLLDAVAPLARATMVERGRSHGVIATVYHLIDRGSSAQYQRAVESAARDLPGLSVHVSGPAPCYAFS